MVALVYGEFYPCGAGPSLDEYGNLGVARPFAEKHLGRSRYLLVYLGSGFGATVTLFGLVLLAQGFDYEAFPAWLAYLTTEIRYGYQVWVGASGSIMGMIGAIAVVLWQGWQRFHLEAAGRQFRLICLIIVIQFAVDLSSPNVSFLQPFTGPLLGNCLNAFVEANLRGIAFGNRNSMLFRQSEFYY